MKSIKSITAFFITVSMLLGLLASISMVQDSVTVQTAWAADSGTNKVFLPLVGNHYPFSTVFGIDLGAIKDSTGLTDMTVAGAQWVRRGNFSWAKVEPNKGDRNWDVLATLEAEMIRADQAGMKMILPIHATPDWAQLVRGSYCGPIKQTEFAAFADFMFDLVTRYSVAPYNVKYWEIWNEPDVAVLISDQFFGCWGNPNDYYYGGGYYAEMLKVVYPAIKAADPSSQVLIGGLLMNCDPVNPPDNKDCSATRFYDGILASGGGPYFDGISFHTYDFYGQQMDLFGNSNWNAGWFTENSTLRAKVDYLKSGLARFNVQGKYIMSTEVALLCDVNCTDVYEQTKAHFVAQTYTDAIVEGLLTNVWFNSLGTWRNSGLLYEDLTPRPAYYAYKFASQELADAKFADELTSVDGVKIFVLRRVDRRIWVVYSWDGQQHKVSLPGIPLAAYDTFGNPISRQSTIYVTGAPVYLEWAP